MTKLRQAAGISSTYTDSMTARHLLDRKNHLCSARSFREARDLLLLRRNGKVIHEYREICKKERETSLNDEERRRELSLYEFEVQRSKGRSFGKRREELEDTYRRMTESRKITDAVAQTYRYTCEDSSAMQVIVLPGDTCVSGGGGI